MTERAQFWFLLSWIAVEFDLEIATNAHLARSVRARYSRWKTSWKEADGLVTANPSALAALATHRLTERAWSPSALQRFAVCPYQFMLHGIQRATQPPHEPRAQRSRRAMRADGCG